MLRTPSACAPSSIDSSPITDQSRVVRCGIVSIPAWRSIVAETMRELIPERADERGRFEHERRARLSLLLDGRADRGDLGRCRPAAAADHFCAEVTSVCGELGEVL